MSFKPQKIKSKVYGSNTNRSMLKTNDPKYTLKDSFKKPFFTLSYPISIIKINYSDINHTI